MKQKQHFRGDIILCNKPESLSVCLFDLKQRHHGPMVQVPLMNINKQTKTRPQGIKSYL